MRDLRRGVFIAICAVTCTARASAPAPPWPEGFSVVTIEGARTYKVLKSGGIIGKGGRRLGMGIWYATTSTDLTTLKTAAADLFAYMLPEAAQQHDDAVAVLAEPGWDRSGQPMTFGIIYKLQHDGWHVTPPDAAKPFPPVERPTDGQARTDRSAEAQARASVESWLSLLDAGDVERTWDTAAPVMKNTSTKTTWGESLRGIQAHTGKLAARSLFSMTATAEIPNAPPGKYVMVQFRSRFTQREAAVEEVIAMLCEDSQWRVAGYDVFSSEAIAAKVVLDVSPSR